MPSPSQTKRTRYSLGRIHAAADVLSFTTDPLGALDRARAFKGSVIWSSAGHPIIVPCEKAADDIIRGLKERFPSNFVEDGIRPLNAVHGMAWYERFVILDLDDEQKQQVRRFIAEQAGCEPSEIADRLEDLSAARLSTL